MRRVTTLAATLCCVSWTGPASAHLVAGGDALKVGGQWSDRLVETILILSVLAYSVGLARALARAPGRWPVAKWRVACFFGAITVLALALLSPIDELADVFFAVHMGQHLLLMLVAAPLLAVSDAHLILLRFLRSRRVGGSAWRLATSRA